jgi:hypothetical protein
MNSEYLDELCSRGCSESGGPSGGQKSMISPCSTPLLHVCFETLRDAN